VSLRSGRRGANSVALWLHLSELKGWNSVDRRQTVTVTRFGAATMAAVLLLSGCTSEGTPEGLTCVEPPAIEVRVVSGSPSSRIRSHRAMRRR
jgi:hypothetical protein